METSTVGTESTSSGLAPGLVTADTSNTLPEVNTQPVGKQTEAQIVESMQQPAAEVKPVVQDPQVQEPVAEQTEEEKLAAAKLEEEQEPIVTEEDLSVAKIQQFVKETPELKAAFDKNPAVRNAVFAMARRSAKLTDYQAAFPTVEAAKFAAENSEQFMGLNDLFFDEAKESPAEFWNQLYNNSLLKDPTTGQIVLDQRTQQPISTGAYERVALAYRTSVYGELDNIASSLPAEQAKEAKAAIALVKELAGDGRRETTQAQQPQLTQDQQRLLAEAEQIKLQATSERSERVQEFQQGSITSIIDTIKVDISDHVKRIVSEKQVALTPYEQRNVVNDIYNEIDKLASENRAYQLHFGNLLKRAPLTEAGRKSLVAEARKFSKEVLGSVTSKVIREATSSTTGNAAAKSAKRAEQASHKEVKTTGNAPNPTSPDLKGKALARAKELKRNLTEDEIMAL